MRQHQYATGPVSRERGFTLIELLVVIIVIGLLTGIAVPVFLNQQNKAKAAATRQNIRNLITEITLARENQQASLRTVTGATYSGSSCVNIAIPQVADPAFAGTACGIAWTNAVTKIAAASGSDPQAVKRLMTDGWGRPLLIDENEGEAGQCQYNDAIGSAGSVNQVTWYPSSWPSNPHGVMVEAPRGGFC